MRRSHEDPVEVFVADILPRITPDDPWTIEELGNWFEDTERSRPSEEDLEAMLALPEVAGVVLIAEGKIHRR